jgi:hypothetical protein
MGGQHHAPAALPPGKRSGTHCLGGWVAPRAGVDACGKSSHRRLSIPGPSNLAVTLYFRRYPGPHTEESLGHFGATGCTQNVGIRLPLTSASYRRTMASSAGPLRQNQNLGIVRLKHVDTREGKSRGNWRMEWVASTLHSTSEHGVSSITTADAHNSAASSRLNWRPRRFKWNSSVSPKDEIWFLPVCHHISNAVYTFSEWYKFPSKCC